MPRTLRYSLLVRFGYPRFLADDGLLESRMGFLAEADRDLIHAGLVVGHPIMQMARMLGVTPRRVRHRVQRLVERMNSPVFVGASRAVHLLNRLQTKVARIHIFEGHSLRRTADEAGVSVETVRRVLAEIAGLVGIMEGLRRRYAVLATKGRLLPEEGRSLGARGRDGGRRTRAG